MREGLLDFTNSSSDQGKRSKNVLHHGFPALGCAWGGLDVIFGVYQQKPLESRKNADQQLEKALLSCEEKMLDSYRTGFTDKLFWCGDGKQPRAVALAGESML